MAEGVEEEEVEEHRPLMVQDRLLRELHLVEEAVEEAEEVEEEVVVGLPPSLPLMGKLTGSVWQIRAVAAKEGAAAAFGPSAAPCFSPAWRAPSALV